MRLFENADAVALDKPAGVSLATSSARGRSEQDAVARLAEACGEGSGIGWRLVHRLDVGTTGVVLLARSEAAHRSLTACFQEGRVRKTYRALTWSCPSPPEGVFEDPLGRDPRDGRRMAVRRNGKRAATRYMVLERFPGLSDLRLSPETGRTHQIRVHLAAHGCPVAGDDLYGVATRWRNVEAPSLRRALAQLTHPLLHAERLEIADLGIDVEAPLPSDYLRCLEAARSLSTTKSQ
jgi:23S rRNA pseudouridine1911/1915/1917 synthase